MLWRQVTPNRLWQSDGVNMEWHDLEIHHAREGDVYKDTARIHESHRSGIKSGRICRLFIQGRRRHTLVAVRGLPETERNWIRLDDATRERVGLNDDSVGTRAHFKIKEGHWWESTTWALGASDPAARISVGLGWWSLLLAVIAFIWEFHE